jgi:hypothetical protein
MSIIFVRRHNCALFAFRRCQRLTANSSTGTVRFKAHQRRLQNNQEATARTTTTRRSSNITIERQEERQYSHLPVFLLTQILV